MNKFLFFSILLLVGCHEQTTKQQEKQVENSSVQVPSSVYANSRWKCPYCGMELDVFDTFIMDHKQKKCLQQKSTRRSSYEDDVEDAYKKGYEEGLEKGNKDGYEEGCNNGYNEAYSDEQKIKSVHIEFHTQASHFVHFSHRFLFVSDIAITFTDVNGKRLQYQWVALVRLQRVSFARRMAVAALSRRAGRRNLARLVRCSQVMCRFIQLEVTKGRG